MGRRRTTRLERPRRRRTQSELDAFLDKAADILRRNVDHSEFRGYVFALLFFKRIRDVYLEELARLTERLGDPELAKDPRMHNFVVPDDVLSVVALVAGSLSRARVVTGAVLVFICAFIMAG